jgi:hypothetical protein
MKTKTITTKVSQETADRCDRLRLAAGCEIAPKTIRRTETKIIPFPGVSIGREVTYQNALDDFLREMGYI